MRTDACIDRKQVICKNASHLGYDKIKAQVGDIVIWRDGEGLSNRIGRMIGRIEYAPALSGDKTPVRNHILVVALGEDMSYVGERWVNPDNVLRVQSLKDHRRVMEYFLSDEIVKAPVDEVRRAASDGWSTLAKYREWTAKKAQEQADYDARHKGETPESIASTMERL